MSRSLGNYLGKNSKYASREDKAYTLSIIEASGTDGIATSKIREANGLDRASHIRLMMQLSAYGAIHKVGIAYKNGSPDTKWSVF